MRHLVKQKTIHQKLFLSNILDDSSVSTVKMFVFTSSSMLINGKSLSFPLLVEQNKTFQDAGMFSVNL